MVLPIVLPLITAASLMLLASRGNQLKAIINVSSTLVGLFVALELARRADAGGGMVSVYLASNWEAPFGIVLVADRLSALMLVLVSVVGLGTALYAEAGWSRAGVHFHPLFQVALVGLNGAFLTGDLFNLFVFFEVLLAASYGLQLHGSGVSRVRSGLHFIAVNLLASSLFLVGLALLYGVMGSLTMADIASRIASVPPSERGLLQAGVAILSVAFLIKAAIWPLNSWLAPTYTAASAPVAALFALMTKVGIYALLRLWTLFFPMDAGASVFGGDALLAGGLLTIAVGTIGLMGAIHLGRIASYSVIVSSGTLLAALGMGVPVMLSAALFYLVSATLAVSALFLLSEIVERAEGDGHHQLKEVEVEPDEDTNLDDDETPLVGRTFPVSNALLGLAFILSALIVAGLPPLSGFVAKLALLMGAVSPGAGGVTTATVIRPGGWWMVALLLISGLVATVSLSRAGIRYFWTSAVVALRVRSVEAVSVVALIFSCVLLTLFAEPVLRYTNATAAGLHAPRSYIDGVLSTKPRPGPTRPDVNRPLSP